MFQCDGRTRNCWILSTESSSRKTRRHLLKEGVLDVEERSVLKQFISKGKKETRTRMMEREGWFREAAGIDGRFNRKTANFYYDRGFRSTGLREKDIEYNLSNAVMVHGWFVDSVNSTNYEGKSVTKWNRCYSFIPIVSKVRPSSLFHSITYVGFSMDVGYEISRVWRV